MSDLASEMARVLRWLRQLPRVLYSFIIFSSAVAGLLAVELALDGTVGPPVIWVVDFLVLVCFWSSHLRYVQRERKYGELEPGGNEQLVRLQIVAFTEGVPPRAGDHAIVSASSLATCRSRG